jgi:hypothetical protein
MTIHVQSINMQQYVGSENSDISHMCLSQSSEDRSCCSSSQQSQTRIPIIRGFSKDNISVYIRSPEESPAQSQTIHQLPTVPRWSRGGPTTFVVGSEGSTGSSEYQGQPSVSQSSHRNIALHSNPYHNDVFEDSEDEESVGESSQDDVEWEDEVEDDSSDTSEDTQIFSRVNTPPLFKSPKSSLTNLMQAGAPQEQDFEPVEPTQPTTETAAIPAVLNARECRQHMFQTEFVGSLPDHIHWERRMSDKRMRASYQHLSSQTEASISQQWNQALDSQLWSMHW